MRARVLSSLVALGIALTVAAVAHAAETVMVCDVYGDQVAPQPAGAAGIGATTKCPGDDSGTTYPPGGMAIWTRAGAATSQGTSVHWSVNAPSGLTITSVYIPHMYSWGIDDNSGWGGGFFWKGGSSAVDTFDGESGWSSGYTGSPTFSWPAGGTPYFGWQVVCGASTCTNGGSQWLSVELLELGVSESGGPLIAAPDGLWQASGWIRGDWAIHYGGDSPSGLCSLSASLNGQALPGSTSTKNLAVWHQCSAPTVDQTVDTSQFGQGALSLVLSATDAANNSGSVHKTVYVDNLTPGISLSGPTDAPTTAGVQYVTATASAGPSGVAGISCSLDGSATRWYGGSSAQIAVQGLGVHQVSCDSENNAHDSAGNPASSPTATWTLSIRQPSVSALAFDRVVGGLRCHAVRERVRIPAHWVVAYHDHHRIRIRVPAQTRRANVVHCHPRVVRRRVRVHGHWRTERVVEVPHAAFLSSRRARPGASTVVSGWLGTSSGTALPGQAVRVLAAPADDGGALAQVATATTAANGSWSAKLPPGPSRTVVAEFGGSSTAEPAVSAPVRLIVPASLALRIAPRRAHWGGRIRITGRLRGGYIPATGKLLVLWVGWAGGSTEIGHIYTRRDGSFATHYTFLRGNGRVRYRFWIASTRESDYPYAPGRSRPVAVEVGP